MRLGITNQLILKHNAGGLPWIEGPSIPPKLTASLFMLICKGTYFELVVGVIWMGHPNCGVGLGHKAEAPTALLLAHNAAAEGGGAALRACELGADSGDAALSLEANVAEGDGGGAWVGPAARLVLTNSLQVLRSNRAGRDGGGAYGGGGTIVLHNASVVSQASVVITPRRC